MLFPRRSPYVFPPGLEHNLIWYATHGRFRPGDPITLFEQLVREFGDIAHYRLGHKHIVFVNRPDYIREILVVQHDNFRKERTVRRTKVLLGEGLITAEGAAHRTQRRLQQPAFHRQRVREYAEIMATNAADVRDRWGEGTTLNVAQQMLTLTLDIVSQALFGVELRDRAQELADAVNSIMGMYNFLILLPAAELLLAAHAPLPQLRTFTDARRRIDRCVYGMLDDVSRAPERSRGTLLETLVASEPVLDSEARCRLRDQIVTSFLAGFETVANALTWTWYLLSQNPEAEQRLHHEIDRVLGDRSPNVDDVPELAYTNMVLSESMRLFPPAWAMGRESVRDFDLGPYRLPKGTTMLMSQFILHRDARYFPDPLRFDPERFSAEAKAERERLVYFPFGAGPRQCIGEAFAWMEATLVLATIAQRWRLRLVPGHRVEPQPLITLRPRYGMLMRVEARRTAPREMKSTPEHSAA